MTANSADVSRLTPSLLALLRRVDTPTVCNAIEVAQGRRGFNRFTKGTMQHSNPGAPAAVGFAVTARIRALAPPLEASDIVRQRRLAYFRSMVAGPSPRLAVVEDLDYPDAIGGWWGEVHGAVHRGLGVVGAVTNGVVRDLDVLDPDFPVLAGSIGPSHGYVHLVDIGQPVRVMGMEVMAGELVHADRHGAIVIPDDVIDALEAAIERVIETEAIVLKPARSPEFDIETLERVWGEFERART